MRDNQKRILDPYCLGFCSKSELSIKNETCYVTRNVAKNSISYVKGSIEGKHSKIPTDLKYADTQTLPLLSYSQT